MVPPARPPVEPAPFVPLMRPILIVKPTVERIERTENNTYREYSSGYQPVRDEREHDTEPIVIPPAPAPIVNVHVVAPPMQQRSPEVEQFRTPQPWPEKERDGDYRTPPARAPYSEVRPRTPARTDPVAPIPDDRPAAQGEPIRDRARVIHPERDIQQDKTPDPNKNSSPVETKTIQPPNKNNSPAELFEPDKTAPQADAPAFKKVGKVGRQRRYDELGIDDVEPIKEVVLFRHQMGSHWPGLSKDMENYYERMYFTKPKRGSKDAKHSKCWERRERWINPPEPA